MTLASEPVLADFPGIQVKDKPVPPGLAQDGSALDLDVLARETYSAVFSDVCDAIGKRNQTLQPGARLVAGPDRVLIGLARTAISMPVNEIPERPYGGEIDFVDSLAKDDLAVVDCSRKPAAAWGELFSTASAGRGARQWHSDKEFQRSDKKTPVFRRPAGRRGLCFGCSGRQEAVCLSHLLLGCMDRRG